MAVLLTIIYHGNTLTQNKIINFRGLNVISISSQSVYFVKTKQKNKIKTKNNTAFL